MPENIKDRIAGLENIIHGVYHNQELLEYIRKNLHRETFNLSNNKGLLWIWINTMAIQIIDFYKLINKHEKFSFIKIINVAKNLKLEADYEQVEKHTQSIISFYEEQEYEAVRSKYLAHQDLNVPEMKTDLENMNKFSEKAIELFELFSTEFKYTITNFDEEVESSFREIFETIDEYEKVKALFLARLIQKEKFVEIAEVQNIIGERHNGS